MLATWEVPPGIGCARLRRRFACHTHPHTQTHSGRNRPKTYDFLRNISVRTLPRDPPGEGGGCLLPHHWSPSIGPRDLNSTHPPRRPEGITGATPQTAFSPMRPLLGPY